MLKGRIWLLLGVAAGVAIGIGKLPYFAGAATSLSDTALRIAGSGGHALVRAAARHGASRRVVEGITAIVSVLVPGVAALLLIYAARTTLHLRALIAVLLGALGVAAFFYLPHGTAIGVAVLAFAAAGIAVAATGPLVAAPLAALAALIATSFLPRILSSHSTLPNVPVRAINQAFFASAGSPYWLRVVVLAIAALPFAIAARLIVR
ncbi:MAG: hypothetical protein ABSD85_09965 [Acidimicrobiales bacterium]|jgi:hypothetical protein